MKRTRFTEKPIVEILKQDEAGLKGVGWYTGRARLLDVVVVPLPRCGGPDPGRFRHVLELTCLWDSVEVKRG